MPTCKFCRVVFVVGRGRFCIKCHRANNNRRQHARKHRLTERFLGGQKCAACATSNIQVLEFDHQTDTKRCDVKRMLHGNWREDIVAAEASKCVILCGNCHAKKTAVERLYYTHLFLETGIVADKKMKRGERKMFVVNHLRGNPCVQCGESDIRCLEFDHIDPTTKFRKVCAIVENNTLEILKAEIDKCRVLCRNCHRLHTNTTLGLVTVAREQ